MPTGTTPTWVSLFHCHSEFTGTERFSVAVKALHMVISCGASLCARWMQASLRPLVQKEAQLLLVCHLLGPLLLRLTNEKPKVLLEVCW